MRTLAGICIGLALLASLPASASPATDALSECFKDNTSGKDRKELARWVFIAMSAHPEIRSLTNATDAARQETDKGMAQLFTRLLTEKCSAQTQAAIEQDGANGMATAFKSLGEVAMMELMSNPDVSAALSAYTQFLDKDKFEAAFRK